MQVVSWSLYSELQTISQQLERREKKYELIEK